MQKLPTYLIVAGLLAFLAPHFAAAQDPTGDLYVARAELRITRDGERMRFAAKGEIVRAVETRGDKLVLQSSSGGKGLFDRRAVTPLAEAGPIITELLKADPENATLYMVRASVSAAGDEYEKAIADCSRALKYRPDDPKTYVNRGVYYATLGRNEEAVADFNSALKLNPEDIVARVNRVASLLAIEQYDEAVADLNHLIASDRKNPDLYVQRGTAWQRKGEHDKAIADFDRALDIDAKYIPALGRRGFTFYLKRDHRRAVADFDRVIKLSPDDAMAYNNRGYNRQQLGDYQGARDDYEAAISRSPDLALAYQNKAWLLATCPEARFRDGQKAFEAASRACQLRKFKVADDVKALAAAYAESGDFARACEHQEKVVEMTEKASRAEEEAILKLYRSEKPYRFDRP